AEWAPQRLIETLASDDIEVARPVIAASPLLKDECLIRLLAEATLAHRVEVAQRPRLSAAVVEAVIDPAEPAGLAAPAGPARPPASMHGLTGPPRNAPAPGQPLSHPPRPTTELAETLYLWVGQSLRSAIVSRFDVDEAKLDAAIAASVAGQEKPKRSGPTA